ncbi:phospholipid carrier-dependent glycosyltransferase [bacterium]|nr:phospholipid carrier-dependent glycosyltransferase [bacterium]
MLKKYFYPIAISVLLVIMFGLMFFSARGDSMIVDEDAHIPAGFSYVTTGDYRLNPEHPPLIKDLAALPLVLTGQKFDYDYWRSNADGKAVNNQWEMGWDFIYRSGNNADDLILLARIPMMLVSLIFGFFVFMWAKELYGKKAGLFALILFVFNTNIIAHSRYVTTDLGVSFAFFLSMFLTYRYIKKPNWKTLLWAGVGFGIVLITKFSAVVLAPTYFIVWVMLILRKSKDKKEGMLERIYDSSWINRAVSGFLAFLTIVGIGVLLMWLFYIPHTMNMPAGVQKDLIAESLPGDLGIAKTARGVLMSMSDNVITRPLSQWLLGFSMVAFHVEGGHDSFLLGQVSNQGWWYYYPVTIFLKTQLALFGLVGLAFILRKKFKEKDWFTEVYLWVLPVTLLAMGMQGKLNLGIRYMLPIYAFIFVWSSRLVDFVDFKLYWEKIREGISKSKKNIFIPTVTLLVSVLTIWYVLSAVVSFPFYLSYFNESIGGYKNGYHYLTDSNLDWGQDNKRLAEWVEDNNINQISVDVFPGPMPAKYYLGNKMVEWHVQQGRPTGYFAISATFYQSSRAWKKANNNMDYAWLDELTPIKNIGGSILVYNLK